MTYEFQIGDRITFTERVHPKIPHGFRQGDHGRAIATPEIAQQIIPQTGEGTVTRGLRPMKVGDRKVQTVKVRALDLGEIIVVADDAVLTAHPLTLDLGLEDVPASAGQSMYGSDAKGGA